MEKLTKGVKGQRPTPHDKGEADYTFKKEWREKYPDGTVMIDGVPQQQQQPKKKKNWQRKKNVTNLSLDLDSHVPVMQTPVKVVYPTDIPENTSQSPPLKELEKLVESIKPEIPQQPIPPSVETLVLEEGEIPDSGNYQYGTLQELLASVGVCCPCPIHNEGMNEIHSQRE